MSRRQKKKKKYNKTAIGRDCQGPSPAKNRKTNHKTNKQGDPGALVGGP